MKSEIGGLKFEICARVQGINNPDLPKIIQNRTNYTLILETREELLQQKEQRNKVLSEHGCTKSLLITNEKDEETETKPVVDDEAKFASEFDDKVHVSEPVGYKEVEEDEHHDTLLDKFHQADDKSSSSCSSSDEEDDEEKKKRKKEKKEKKGLKEKLVEKLPGHTEEDKISGEKKVDEVVYSEPSDSVPPHQEEDVEKKGFLGKIKDKISGEKKVDEVVAPPPTAPPSTEAVEGEEKKGIMDKIKDKILGPKNTEEKKDHE